MHKRCLVVVCTLAGVMAGCHPEAGPPPRTVDARTMALRQGKTHLVVVETVEVEPLKQSGQPWDFGVGVEQKPDLRVTVLRRDLKLEPQLAELQRQLAELSAREGRRRSELMEKQPPAADAGQLQQAEQRIDNDPEVRKLQDQVRRKAEEIARLKEQFAPDTRVVYDTPSARFDEETVGVSVGDTINLSVWDQDLVSHDLIGERELTVTPEVLKQGRLVLKFGDVRELRVSFRSVR